MVDGSRHGIRRTKEGPGLQHHNGVEMCMHRAWVTHRRCPLALEQSVTGGAGINVNQQKNDTVTFDTRKTQYKTYERIAAKADRCTADAKTVCLRVSVW